MLDNATHRISRRQVLTRGALAAAALVTHGRAQAMRTLEIASAGSIRSMLDGPLKAAAAKALGLELHTHSQGADAVARAIVSGSVGADIFIPVTAGPMLTVMRAGKAQKAYPVAKTEMVILYSPKSRFVANLAAAAAGKRNWWEVLQEPGLRFARSNPLDDPSGRSILFTMMLAAKKYNVSDLAQRVLGAPLNPVQVQPGTDIRAGLEDGSIDAIGGYRISGGPGKLPFIPLADEVNLTDTQVRVHHPEIVLEMNGATFHPEPLLFYAAVLEGATNPVGAARFISWMQGQESTSILKANGFDLPGGVNSLTA